MRYVLLFKLLFFFVFNAQAREGVDFKQCLPVVGKKIEKASDYNYIIAPGVFNEVISYYMTQYKRHFLEIGVPRNQIKRVNNFTVSVPDQSALKIKKAILGFKNKKKVVIFSHSKGALESLYMLIKHKDIREKVYKVILLQGPLRGVSSYDLTYGMPGEKVAEKSFLFRAYRWIAKFSFISFRFNNFSKLKVEKDFNYESLKEEGLLNKLIFVRSYKSVPDMNWRMRYMGGLYKDYLNERSDGVILYKEQLPVGVTHENSCVIDFYADHGDFVKTRLLKSATKVKRVNMFIDHILFNKEQPKTTP